MSQPFLPNLPMNSFSLSDRDSAVDPILTLSPLCQQLIELIPQVIWFANEQGEILRLNSVWQQYTGETIAATLGQPFFQYFHGDDQLRLKLAWQMAVTLKQPLEERTRLLMADGSFEWFLVSARPLTEHSGDYDVVPRLGLMRRLASVAADPNLLAGQEFLEALFENISDGLVACDADGQLVLFNRAAQKFHGLPPEPIHSDAWAQHYDLYNGTGETLLTPEDVPLRQALQGQKVRDAAMMIIPKSGKARSLIANADPIYTVTGQKLGAVALMRDVTDYRQAAAALAASERRFQAIFNQAFQLIGLLSPAGILLEVNQTALNFGGLSVAAVQHRPFWETRWWQASLTAPEQLKAAIQRAAAGEFVRYEVEVLGAGDQVATIDFSLSPVFDPAGQVMLIISEGRDISARKQIEAELRMLTLELEARVNARTLALEATIVKLQQKAQQLADREAQFRVTFEQVAMGCAHVAPDGRWLRVNEKLCEIVGYSREELLQKTFQDITYPDDSATDLAYVEQLLAGEITNCAFEKRYCRKDGSLVWVQVTGALRRQPVSRDGELGEPLYFIVMIEEIGDRKLLELQNAENYAALEQIKADLEKRNEDLDQFVHIVSHDLKAPLRGIANLATWLAEDLGDQLPAENQEQLGLMRQRVAWMDRLIEGLLRYARVGREQMIAELVNSHQLVLEIIDSLAPSPTFQIQVVDTLPILMAKRLLLSQVFANLLSNALKHHDRAVGRIAVGCHDQVKHYKFYVTDDGPGIPIDQQERIFGVFQTLNGQDSPENTGIGLSLVKKIVETEGGTIQVYSVEGRGSRFEFTWPKQA